MVKFSRGKVIVFDMDEAVSFHGESGPYLQYRGRAREQIFDKLKERHGLDEAGVVTAVASAPAAVLTAGDEEAHDLWGLVLEAAPALTKWSSTRCGRSSSRCWRSTRSLSRSPSTASITSIPSSGKNGPTCARGAGRLNAIRSQLTRTLELMGCTVPVQM